MDRQSLTYMAVAVIVLTLIGSLTLGQGPARRAPDPAPRPALAQKEVRPKPPAKSAPETTAENEEPPVDETAEEPPIE